VTDVNVLQLRIADFQLLRRTSFKSAIRNLKSAMAAF